MCAIDEGKCYRHSHLLDMAFGVVDLLPSIKATLVHRYANRVSHNIKSDGILLDGVSSFVTSGVDYDCKNIIN